MKFTLAILPDGHAILSCDEDITPAQHDALKGAWDQWRETPRGVAILANCSVEHVTSIDIDLPVPETRLS